MNPLRKFAYFCTRKQTKMNHWAVQLKNLLWVFFIFCGSPVFSHGDIEALLQFKKGIRSDPKKLLSNWSPDSVNPCNWTGIQCSQGNAASVSGIDLAHGNLQGTISPELGNLSQLQLLNLSHNLLSEFIPPSLGRLTFLRILWLQCNSLTGKIPPSLGSCSLLTQIDLSSNYLSGSIPPSLLKCRNLEDLSVAHNSLSGSVPVRIGNYLPKLRNISLDYNNLTGTVPDFAGNCSNLIQLGLSHNQITGSLPDSLLTCKKLLIIKIAHNFISGTIPRNIGNFLKRLQNLTLDDNSLVGIIPPSVGNMSRLIKLDLANNKLHGNIPLSLLNCRGLRELKLSHNKLSGTIPSEIGSHLRKLKTLTLSKNNFIGTIPSSIVNLSHLVLLDMSQNNLEGVIPSGLAHFPKLEDLLLSQNQLVSGITNPEQPIPLLQAFTNSTGLQHLNLNGNNLTGTLPSNMGLIFQQVQDLNLSRNGISGSIPPSLGNLSALKILDLSNNQFTGTIPRSLGAAKSLKQLNLCDNQLQGEIPQELGNPALSSLYLSGNQLWGKIPASLGNLRSLGDLYLNRNNLSAEIPPELGKCVNLVKLDLSNNKLSGSFSPQLAEQLNVQYLNLSCNNLSGSLPPSMANSLEVVDLSYNHFTGTKPSWIYSLASVNVSHNDFQRSSPCGFIKVGQACLPMAVNPNQWSSHKNKVLLFILVGLGAIAFVAFISVLSFICVVKKSRGVTAKDEARTWSQNNQFMVVSERELVKATGNFSPLNFLGKGSYGLVYKGILSDGSIVAAKVFTEEQGSESSDASFMRECATLGQVRHRNLVKIITACYSDSMKALILEFMPNGSLHDLLHRPRKEDGRLMPLSLQSRLRILKEVASALCYLHHDCCPPIVHCDLKPHNVLLDEDMTAHLSDFGMARFLGRSDVSATLNLQGSLGYIAPEYGVGAPAWSRGDVYSFGIMVLEMMTRTRATDPVMGKDDDVTLCSWVSMALCKGTESWKQELITNRRGQRELQLQLEMGNDKDNNAATVEAALKLGVWCSKQQPHERPSMRKVEASLAMLLSGRVAAAMDEAGISSTI